MSNYPEDFGGKNNQTSHLTETVQQSELFALQPFQINYSHLIRLHI